MGIKVYDHYDSAFLRHYLILEYEMDYKEKRKKRLNHQFTPSLI